MLWTSRCPQQVMFWGPSQYKDVVLPHYSDAIMGAMASQITCLTIVYSNVYSGADQRKHQSSASLAFVRGIHRWPVIFPAQMASNAENVSIWWRHHEYSDPHVKDKTVSWPLAWESQTWERQSLYWGPGAVKWSLGHDQGYDDVMAWKCCPPL